MQAHSQRERQTAIDLHLSGQRLTVISKTLGIHYDLVRSWIKRYKTEGESSIVPRYGNCGRHSKVAAVVKESALAYKRQHPQWGASFIRLQLLEAYPDLMIPKERRLQQWFRQSGLQSRKTRLPQPGRQWASRPLQCVQVDAKEELKTKDGKPCCYLTFTDEYTGSALDAFVFPPQWD